MERKHSGESSDEAQFNTSGACICHHCGFRCRHVCDLCKHLTWQHSIIFSCETVSFENKSEFEAWKATIEELNYCSFVKTTGAKITEKNGEKVQYFSCNRCGTYRPSGRGMRVPKSQGTCKLNMNCTAGLKASTTADGTFNVEACHTYHGHTMELQHIWLSKQGRQEIASKIQQGVPADKILDDIRQSMPNNLHRNVIGRAVPYITLYMTLYIYISGINRRRSKLFSCGFNACTFRPFGLPQH